MPAFGRPRHGHYTISKTAFSIVGLLAATLTLAACKDDDPKAPPPKQVEVTQPQAATVNRYLYETGTTTAVSRVDLVARVSGALQAIDYQDGMPVKKGDRLFLIEPEEYEAKVKQAEASVQEAKANLDNAVRQLARQNQLNRSSVTTQTEVDNAVATRDAAQAQLSSAEASLAEARLNLGYTTITAPFDGFVTEHLADVGALVGGNSSTTTLATIVQLDPIQVSFSVSDTAMLQIRKQIRANGQTRKDIASVPVEIGTQIDKDFPFTGRLDYAAPETASDTGTLSVRAVFANADRTLLPGLFVRIRIPMGKTDALLLPDATIGTDQQGRFVLIVNKDGVVERRNVTLLDRSDSRQQVQGPLSADDWVISNVAAAPRVGDAVIRKQAHNDQSEATGAGQPAAATPQSK